MKNWIKKIKNWWKPFYEKHEVEIICSAIQGPSFGIAVCLPPKGAPIWFGVCLGTFIVIAYWVIAYICRKHETNKRKKIYERYNKSTS